MHVWRMSTHVQIRNLPPALHRKLKVRVANHGTTITSYVRDLIERDLSTPSMKEWSDMVRERTPVTIPADELVSAIHQDRAARDEQLRQGLKNATPPNAGK